jgi:hypothetical protein
VARATTPRGEKISFTVTAAMKASLEAEAWEEQRSLADYIRGLLERRGKWARTVGTAGGYDIQAPETAKRVK